MRPSTCLIEEAGQPTRTTASIRRRTERKNRRDKHFSPSLPPSLTPSSWPSSMKPSCLSSVLFKQYDFVNYYPLAHRNAMHRHLRFICFALLALVAVGRAQAQYKDAAWVKGGHETPIAGVSFSPDSKILAT